MREEQAPRAIQEICVINRAPELRPDYNAVCKVPEGWFFAKSVGTGGQGLYLKCGQVAYPAAKIFYGDQYCAEATVTGFREVKRVEITYGF